ncbi:MAG: rRNA maturation RNase YbeY [Actinobacteria bacterium]|nr:rRNA maturation RNase YbeY [Actinomycetota bacterium]
MNVVEVFNSTRTAIDEELVARLVGRVLDEEGVDGAEVSVAFVGETRIRALNREHRGRDEVTDVLSFPLEEWESPDETVDATLDGAAPTAEARAAVVGSLAPDLGAVAEAAVAGESGPPLLLGDVVICARQALRQARADDLPPSLEVAVLLTHGTLHLLGYDHETDAGQMALRQAEVLELVDWEGLVEAPPR